MIIQHNNPNIDLSNPGHVKLCILSEGINNKAATVFGELDFAENPYQYGNGNKIAESRLKFPSYVIINSSIAVGLNYNSNSPWSIAVDEMIDREALYISYRGKKIMEAMLPSEPSFYSKEMSNGRLVKSALSLYSLHIASFFSRGWCHFFETGMPCSFCSLGHARKTVGKNNLTEVTPQVAAEAMQIALETEKNVIHYVNHTAGTYSDYDIGVKKFLKIVDAINKVLPDDKYIRQHVLTFPPNTLSLIEDLVNAGMGTLAYSIEVFDPNTFKQICPGKHSLYGYGRFLEAFDNAVEIVGCKKMYANFVAGLESVETMIDGFRYFAGKGIAPSVNVFHPDPGTPLERKSKPSVDYLLQMVDALNDVYKKYDLTCMFEKGGSRNTLDAEVCGGFFNS